MHLLQRESRAIVKSLFAAQYPLPFWLVWATFPLENLLPILSPIVCVVLKLSEDIEDGLIVFKPDEVSFPLDSVRCRVLHKTQARANQHSILLATMIVQ